jgi:hypothetical protein
MERRLPRIRRRDDESHMRSSTNAASEKLFGKYDDIVRLLLGFLLTAVVGTYLSHRYTTQQADLAAAGKVFNEHSKLIGDRHFAMTQVTLHLRDFKGTAEPKSNAELQSKWNTYKMVLQEWNSARGFNREMIKLYFGNAIWNKERDIHYLFRAWGQSLEMEFKTPDAVDFKCLETKTDELLVLVHSLRVDMARAMQQGQVGGSRDQTAVNENPRPERLCPSLGSQSK